MFENELSRRKFLQSTAIKSAGLSVLPFLSQMPAEAKNHIGEPLIKFAVIGINHAHIYGMTEAVIRGGGQLVSLFAKEDDLAAAYMKKYPQVKRVQSEKEILEDSSIKLVLSSGIPVDRAPLGIRVMQHGKDYMADKPGIITLEQLEEARRVQKETKRIYSISYSERLDVKSSVKAGELIKAGAIGKVIQTIGLGPHRIGMHNRPTWFFDKQYYGGILCDIGSHQFDQFLYFTGSTSAEVVASQVGNINNKNYPNFEDFGDVMIKGNGGTGYIRVDWFTPNGLKTWGDGRLTILGTEGYIELRKYIDIAGKEGGDHLFLVNNKETLRIDCSDVVLPYGPQIVQDVLNRTETAMSQEHCFLATELALKAQKFAKVI